MKNEVKLRFKGYELSYNPKSLSLKKERNLLQLNSPLSGNIIQDLGFNAAVITGEGVFYGSDAKKQYDLLYSLFLNGKSEVLHIPGYKPFYAYFTSISSSRKAGADILSYSFKFIEDCKKSEGRW